MSNSPIFQRMRLRLARQGRSQWGVEFPTPSTKISGSLPTLRCVFLRHDKTTEILDEIMKDLTEPNMIILGVYGSSISNKINLVEQTKKRVERDGLFDTVLTASQVTNPNLQGIQHELGDQLGLNLYDITTLKEEKARLLSDKIKSKEKILIILALNDLKGGIDLAEIGIPFGDDHKGSKILLIAQTRELLSDQMKTQKQYCVDNDPDRLDPKLLLKRKRASAELRKSTQTCTAKGVQSMSMSMSIQHAARPNGRPQIPTMERTLDDIERAVKQPNMRIVGVYGSREGRELVVEQITRRLKLQGVFNVVVHVMASMIKKNKSPDLKRIQEELANKLSVQLPPKTKLPERATLLCDTIKSMGNILIILDDLKAGIDMAELGIPFGNQHLPSKIMLLAQTREVLSKQMNAPQIEFCLDLCII